MHSGKNAHNSPNKPSGRNTFIRNEIQVNPESKFKFCSIRRKKNNDMMLEEVPVRSERIKELEGVLTLGEQQALEEKESS